MDQKWVSNLVIVRHGESTRNAERDPANARSEETYGGGIRDMDVELTPKGVEQATETGKRIRAHLGFDFDVAFTSPYRRTVKTAQHLIEGMEKPLETIQDERIREKDFGVLDGLTKTGIAKRYPDEIARKQREKKYYYRPIAGESYPDVNQRVHGFIGMLIREWSAKNVLVVCHSVIVLSFRRLLEHLSEEQVLAIDEDKAQQPKNCGLTWYRFDPSKAPQGKLRLEHYNAALYEQTLTSSEPSRTSDMERRTQRIVLSVEQANELKLWKDEE